MKSVSPAASFAWSYLVGALVCVATLALMIATEPMLAIVWDEGYTLGRQERVRQWIKLFNDRTTFDAWKPPPYELVQPDGPKDPVLPPRGADFDSRADLLQKPALLYFWPFGREEPHGHPPFYAIVGMIGDYVTPDWQVLPRARLGPMLVFSLAAGAIYSALAKRFGAWSGVVGASAWVLHPHLFAHGHYATVDAILASLWVLAVLHFAGASRVGETAERPYPSWPSVLALGLVLGFAADTKLTGWFLPLPLLVWALVRRDRKALIALVVAAPIAIATLYAFNPPWWRDPIDGVIRFLRSNLTRGETIPIPVLFLGQIYQTPVESLPWYNTLAWTLFASPVLTLLLALVATWRVAAGKMLRDYGSLFVVNWVFLLVLRALPHTPGHDGTRQFLPAFGMLAVLAGLGAAWFIARWKVLGKVVSALTIAELAAGLALMMPVPLSYYSPIIGGLPGARALGLEPTYFWDALTGDAISWLNEHTDEDEAIVFASNPTSFMYLQRTGKLPRAFTPEHRVGRPKWLVMQDRPGAFRPDERLLISRREPAHVVSKFGVPLLWVFPVGPEEGP